MSVPGPGHEETIMVKDEWGNEYTFRLRVRVTNTPGRSLSLKPEFHLRDWHAFVNEKQHKACELVYFWWDDKADRILRVQAQIQPYARKFFGKDFTT